MEIIKFKKLKNVRDISYFNIKEKMLLRGGSLFRLCAYDKKKLVDEYNLKVVIDLRSIQEKEKEPDYIVPGVNYYHFPLIDMEEITSGNEKTAKTEIRKKQTLPDIYNYYRLIVSPNKKESWTKIFDCLLRQEEGLIFIHCTAGKDRTGIVSAIILYALGIDKETIYKDYLLTNENIIFPLKYKIFSLLLKKEVRKEFKDYFKANKNYLDEAFSYINETYGSIDDFLLNMCGLTNEKREELEGTYLLP